MRCALLPTNETECIWENKKKIMINHKSSWCHLKAHKMSAGLSVCSLASVDTLTSMLFVHSLMTMMINASISTSASHAFDIVVVSNAFSTKSTLFVFVCVVAIVIVRFVDRTIGPLLWWTNGLNRMVKTCSRCSTKQNVSNDNQMVRLIFNSVAWMRVIVARQYAINTN